MSGTFQRRECQRDTGEGALVIEFGSFLSLDDLPQMVTTFVSIAEDVRVTAFELVRNASQHVLEREMAGFFGHARMKYDLQLKISKLIN